MVERVYRLFEIITILIGLHVLHKGNKRPGIATMAYVALALIIASVIEAGWLHGAFVNLIYLGLIIVCKLEYGDRIFDAVVYVVMDIVLLGILQLFGSIVVYSIFRVNRIDKIGILCIIIFSSIVLLIMNRYLKINRYIEIVLINGGYGKLVLLIASIVCMLIINFFKTVNFISWKDVIGLPVLAIIISIVLFQWQKEKFENKQRQQELLAYERYNLVYKDLIKQVRRRQHDFNNHINAVFSMNTVATDLKELVKWQNEYCLELLAENNTNRLLRDDVSSILAGFIYSKIEQAEGKGIRVKYEIDVDGVEEHISFVDFVEIFGNLFDNAMDEVSDKEIKMIDFAVTQDEHILIIKIANPCDRTKSEKIQHMFLEGVSSKGEGRGVGLANVNRIVDRYEGRTQAIFVSNEGIDQIVFNVVLCLK